VITPWLVGKSKAKIIHTSLRKHCVTVYYEPITVLIECVGIRAFKFWQDMAQGIEGALS
jgi:hypothetical protein